MRKIFISISLAGIFISGLYAKVSSETQSWKNFKARGVGSVRMTHVTRTNTLKINMGGIKSSLKRSGVRGKVSIDLYSGGRKIGSLGTYSSVNSIPGVKSLSLGRNGKAPGGGSVVLVFRNSSGAVVARITSRAVKKTVAYKGNTSIPR